MIEQLGQAVELLTTSGTWTIILRSLEVSGLAVAFAAALGVPLGVMIGISRFRGRGALVAVINTGMALPPVVVGLLVYLMLSRSGPLGFLGLLFTARAMVIAQTILALPLILGITVSGMSALPAGVLLQARSLGASRLQEALIALREGRMMLFAALIAGSGRVIAEVGAVMMVGGNFRGETQVMTTAIMEEVRKGDFSLAISLGIILLVIALAANGALAAIQHRTGTAATP